MQLDLKNKVVCIVGLGYVGLPLAEAFAVKLKVIGFDTDEARIEKLEQDGTYPNICFTTDPEQISQADFVIICVPTPLTGAKKPDLSYVRRAAEAVSPRIKKGSIIILESTVYPGVTEEIVKPILESSGLGCGQDFKIGYSPERINPGDKAHTIDRVIKVVSGMDEDTTEIIAQLYELVALGVFRTKNIKTAEAAKVIENIQRDINIALMNELSLIFGRMGLNTGDVLEAAATKWNFQRYSPGLVGGHCIPVDPYYLIYKAEELGYHAKVILAGRDINDYMPKHIAEMAIKALGQIGKAAKRAKILIMGLTYKENVVDIRETPAKELIKELKKYKVDVFGYDPLLDNIENEFGIRGVGNLQEVKVDGTILTVSHDVFREITLDELKSIMGDKPILIDIRGFYDRLEAENRGFYYWRL
ncbi:nucleotide sugar dehydrogenase [Chloroflexota bacterium]